MLFDQLLQVYHFFLGGRKEGGRRGGDEAQDVCPTFYASMRIVWAVVVEHCTNGFAGVDCSRLTSHSLWQEVESLPTSSGGTLASLIPFDLVRVYRPIERAVQKQGELCSYSLIHVQGKSPLMALLVHWRNLTAR